METLKRSRRILDKEAKEAKNAEELAMQKRVKHEESAFPGRGSNCFADLHGGSAAGFSGFAAMSSSSSAQPRRVYGSKSGQAKAKSEPKGERRFRSQHI